MQLADILNTAHSLVSMLNSRLSSPGNVRPVTQGNTSQPAEGQRGQSQTSQLSGPQVSCPQRNGSGVSVRQEMARYVCHVAAALALTFYCHLCRFHAGMNCLQKFHV